MGMRREKRRKIRLSVGWVNGLRGGPSRWSKVDLFAVMKNRCFGSL